MGGESPAHRPSAILGAPPAPLPADWLARRQGFAAGQSLRDRDDGPEVVRFVLRGWATRSRWLCDGRRQVLELLLAGDVLPSRAAYAQDHLGALTSCEIASVPLDLVKRARGRSPELDAVLAGMEERRAAILNERIVSLGRRNAVERTAHLCCELLHRLADGDAARTCELPMTQGDIADVLGFSVAHANRVLQSLRSKDLVDIGRGRMRILDYDGLSRLAAFSPAYLARD